MNIESVVFRSGDVILTRSDSCTDQIMHGIINCPYNHVACVYVEPRTQQVYLWEMNGSGPRLIALSNLISECDGENAAIKNLTHVAWLPLHRRNENGEWFHRVRDREEYEKRVVKLESWIEYCLLTPIQFNLTCTLGILTRMCGLSRLKIKKHVDPIYEHPTTVTCSGMLLNSLYQLGVADERVVDTNVTNMMNIVCPADFYDRNSELRTEFMKQCYYEDPVQLVIK